MQSAPHADEDVVAAAACCHANRYCQHACVSTERGDSEYHLHIQGVIRLRGTTAQSVKSNLVRYVAARVDGFVAAEHSVRCIQAKNQGMHTWEGLLGYCIKNEGRPGYSNWLKDVSPAELEKGRVEYLQHGAALKNRIALSPSNLLSRAFMFHTYVIRDRMRTSLLSTLTAMVRCGRFYPDASWVIPRMGGGMERVRAELVWKALVSPADMTVQEVYNVFFSSSSRAHDAAFNFEMTDDSGLQSCVDRALAAGVPLDRAIDTYVPTDPDVPLYTRVHTPVLGFSLRQRPVLREVVPPIEVPGATFDLPGFTFID